jgi:hypothetical protein
LRRKSGTQAAQADSQHSRDAEALECGRTRIERTLNQIELDGSLAGAKFARAVSEPLRPRKPSPERRSLRASGGGASLEATTAFLAARRALLSSAASI